MFAGQAPRCMTRVLSGDLRQKCGGLLVADLVIRNAGWQTRSFPRHHRPLREAPV